MNVKYEVPIQKYFRDVEQGTYFTTSYYQGKDKAVFVASREEDCSMHATNVETGDIIFFDDEDAIMVLDVQLFVKGVI